MERQHGHRKGHSDRTIVNEGCAVAVSYDAEGRVTGIGVLRTKTDFVVLNLQDTCRLFLLNASSAPRLNTPITINDYLQT